MAEGKLKIKLSELIKAEAALSQICNMDLVGKANFQLAAIYDEVEKKTKKFNEEKRNIGQANGKFIYKEGDKRYFIEYHKAGVKITDSEGKIVKLDQYIPSNIIWEQNSDEAYESWKNEMEELLDTEIELDVLPVNIADIKIRESNQAVDAPLKPAVLSVLLNGFLKYEDAAK